MTELVLIPISFCAYGMFFPQRFLAARYDTSDNRDDVTTSAAVAADDDDKTLAGNNDDADAENDKIIEKYCSSSHSSHSSRSGTGKGGDRRSDGCKGEDRRGGGGGEPNEGNAEQRRSAESLLGVLSKVNTRPRTAAEQSQSSRRAAAGQSHLSLFSRCFDESSGTRRCEHDITK